MHQNFNQPSKLNEIDDELVDVLIAISVISKRLATKLINQNCNSMEENRHE